MKGNRSRLIILMADDDEDDCLFAKLAFEQIGKHDLRFVADGLELLRYLSPEEKQGDLLRFPRPDLILLDLNMPQMDGREALKIIRSDPQLTKIPVWIVTTSQEERDILWSKKAGAAGFLIKPDHLDDWTKMFEKLCSSIG